MNTMLEHFCPRTLLPLAWHIKALLARQVCEAVPGGRHSIALKGLLAVFRRVCATVCIYCI